MTTGNTAIVPIDTSSIGNMGLRPGKFDLSSPVVVFGGSGTNSLILKDTTQVSFLAYEFPSRPSGMVIQVLTKLSSASSRASNKCT